MPRYPETDDEYDAQFDREPREVTCRSCGADGLYWQDTWDAAGNRKPRLYEGGKPHVCRPSADDFDEVSS